MSNQPTHDTYHELQQAFDYFNEALFENKLPPCLITLQRERHTMGYYSHKRFIRVGGKAYADEIAMNPRYFGAFPIKEVLSTLVHEMVHQWQAHHGKPSRAGYHNREWANRMEQLGLIPSATGKPGGAKVGQKMGDYIDEGGPFDLHCDDLLTKEFKLSWIDRFPPKTPTSQGISVATLNNDEDEEALEIPSPTQNRSNRIKYICHTCQVQVWGKPNIKILCGKDECDAAPMSATI